MTEGGKDVRKIQLMYLLILMITLCGCGKKEVLVQSPKETLKQEEAMEITLFSFTHTGMSTKECFLYSAEQTEAGIRLYTEELFSGGVIVDRIVEEDILKKLGEIAGKYRLDRWNGFDKSKKQVKDGNTFSLSITLADGNTISAHGSNRFPDGYSDAKQEICELFEDLIDQYGNQEVKVTEAVTEISTESIESQIDSKACENQYGTILDLNYELIMAGSDAYLHMDGTSGIGEVIMNSEEIEADTIGYAFMDVNHDGVTELIIGSIDGERNGKHYGENIYSVYTYKDIPYLLLEGWSRNRCFLLEDGTFYIEGSGGAMYRMLENYVLDKNASRLSCKDIYFTKEKDESFEEIGFYHNTVGECEISVSEELDEDEFWSKYEEYGSRIISFELVPFSMYQYVGEQRNIEITEDEVVSVEWITKEQLKNSRIQSYVADSSQPQVIAALYTSEEIENLKVLSLAYEEVDPMGNAVFSTEELYHYGDFGSDDSFAVLLTMYGTIPYYGISYETADGKTHYYGISESGMDGSAVLVKFQPKK